MARQITVKAFAAWISDEVNVAEVLRRVADGLTLQKAAVAVKQPYTCLHGFFHSTQELEARYLAARRAWADRKQDEALEIADDVEPDRDHVAKAKLQVETYHNQAKAYHRERWGETLRVEKTVTHEVDAGLVGTIGDLLRVAKRPAVTIENVPGQVEADSSPSALPAPAAGEQ